MRDCAFVYEGDHRYVGPADEPGMRKGVPSTQFQGSCAFRADGAVFVDCYARFGEQFSRSTHAILGDATSSIERIPDQRKAKVQTTSHAFPHGLVRTGSPLRLVYNWYLVANTDLGALDYRCHGFERRNGYQTLHIEVNGLPELPASVVGRAHYWFDLERDGHVVRMEIKKNDRLATLVQIELEQVKDASEKWIWFPVRSTIETFAYGPTTQSIRFSDSPFFRETITIVPSSLRINQNLPDSVFQIDSKGGVTDTSDLARVKEEFLHPPPKPKLRTDVRSVQQRLDDQLAEADKNAARLDASIDRERVNWLPWAQGALAIVGFAILAVVGIRRWRGS
jgi:hypothetical protein